ncbi:MAG: hypothetical protein V3R83_02235 [Gammaproteobacteria bacterium]
MTTAAFTNSDPTADAYDRLTLKFEEIDTILHTLSDGDYVCKMPKSDVAVFIRMATEIFDAARDDARKLHNVAKEIKGEQS